MNRKSLLAMPLLTLALIGNSGPTPKFDTTPPPSRERHDAWPEIRTSFPDGVTGIPDLIYSQPLHFRPLRLDLFIPPAAFTGPRPLLVHVHGGAWMLGTKRMGGPIQDFPSVLAAFAAKGFVVATVEYRLDGEAPFPAAIKDVKEAIKFLRRRADTYRIDPSRVGVWGGSAGGQLSALAATSCGVKAFEPDEFDPGKAQIDLAEASACVQAAVPYYGVHDFNTVPVQKDGAGLQPYLGCPQRDCPTETKSTASPITYVGLKTPPMLLIHGLADKLVPASQSKELEARLREVGAQVKALYIPEVDHGLVGTNPAQTATANKQALDATFSFFNEQLKP